MSNTIINTNISAVNSHRQILATGNRLNRSSERISSGMRINRASDDATGLAISEKMRNQIRGLDQAARNSQDGISLVQTAEGAMEEIHRILERKRELTNQAANDVYTNNDRSQILLEIDQLSNEINQIARTTEFNTMRLLGGSNRTPEGVHNITVVLREYERIRNNLNTVLDEYSQARELFNRAETNLAVARAELEAVRTSDDKTFDIAQINLAAAEATFSFSRDLMDFTRTVANFATNGFTAEQTVELTGFQSGGTLIGGVIHISYSPGKLRTLIQENNVADRFNQNLQSINFRTSSLPSVNTTPSSQGTDFLTGLYVTGSNVSLRGNIPALTDLMSNVTSINNRTIDIIDALSSLMRNSQSGQGQMLNVGLMNGGNNTGINISNSSLQINSPNSLASLITSISSGNGVNRSFDTLVHMFNFDEFALPILTGTGTGTTITWIHVGIRNSLTSAGIATLERIVGNSNLPLGDNPLSHGMVNMANVLGAMENDFTPALGLQIQSGANGGQRTDIRLRNMDLSGLGLRSFKHQFEAALLHENSVQGGGRDLSASLHMLDNAIDIVATQRAELGAVQNRLEHTINNLNVSSENLSSANSRIRDTDIAMEMMAFTRANILQQAGMSMLVQANMAPQSVLQLLG